MHPGKLPPDLFRSLLSRFTPGDSSVVLGPGIGRDAAAIDLGGPSLLVAAADPVTFTGDLIGWYAVHVNANDVACLGARPHWFLATLLLPEGCDEGLPGLILDQVLQACRSLDVELIGGHNEITLGLTRPIIAGTMLGDVQRERLVTPQGARPGDALLLTRGIAIEGTAVLAREAAPKLLALGVAREAVDRAREYIVEPGISVVADALTACEAVSVHAMHDPTEGGLATALYEMAEASGTGIVVDARRINVLPETRIICEAAGINPLGLLASGALLIAVDESDAERALSALAPAGASAERIGMLVSAEHGVIMVDDNGRRPVPQFARDEVARFLAEHR